MTAGGFAIGTAQTPIYIYKSWNGADGAILTTYKVTRPGHWVRSIAKKRVKVGKKEYVVFDFVRERYIPPHITKNTKRSHNQWNSYSLDAKTCHRTGANYDGSKLGDYFGDSFPKPFSNNGMVALQSKLVTAVRGHSYNAGVSNAEIGQTLSMVTSTVQRFERSIRSLKKGNIADAARHLGVNHRGAGRVKPLDTKDVSNYWLELQYGWKPLLQDCHDGAEAMAYHLNPPRTTRFVVSRTEPYDYDGSWLPYYKWFAHGTSSVRIICEIQEKLSVPRSLGLLNPASVVWEITPYSFVADWFIPIGTYLDNYNILPVIQGRFLTTQKFKVKAQGYGVVWNMAGANSTCEWTRLIRTPSADLTPQRPEFAIAPGSHTGRFWNSLALLRQLL